MSAQKAKVEIEYCFKCKWLPRAAWVAQELLSTFEDALGEVSLRPGPSGEFNVHIDGERIWNRKAEGQFPEPKVLKQLIRDRIDPDRDLGHSDRNDKN